jgi:hypothetical protein
LAVDRASPALWPRALTPILTSATSGVPFTCPVPTTVMRRVLVVAAPAGSPAPSTSATAVSAVSAAITTVVVVRLVIVLTPRLCAPRVRSPGVGPQTDATAGWFPHHRSNPPARAVAYAAPP